MGFIKTNKQTVVYIILTFIVAGTIWSSTNSQLDRERDAQVTTCLRVQLLRDQANGTNFLIYDTFRAVVLQQQKVIDSGKLRGPALKQAKDAVKRSQKVVDTTVVTGPTDCVAATDHPNTYTPPPPEFIKSNSKRVQIARKHAEAIVLKAKMNKPLYTPTEVKVKSNP